MVWHLLVSHFVALKTVDYVVVKTHFFIFLVTLIMLSVAASYGWTSPTLPKLLAEDSPIPITPDESSWIVSILVLASIFGPLPTAFLVDRYDDKKEIEFIFLST